MHILVSFAPYKTIDTQTPCVTNMSRPGSQVTKFPYISEYDREVLIATRAMELANDADPLIGICPDRRCSVRITEDNADKLIPMVRFTRDEDDIAEMEFSLNALDDYHIVRNDGSLTPVQIRVGDLWKRDGY